MTRTRTLTAALVLCAAATCVVGPAFAQSRTTSSFEANLEAIGPELAARAAQRMAAIRACSSAAAPVREHAGRGKHVDRERYRACMAEHGQMQ